MATPAPARHRADTIWASVVRAQLRAEAAAAHTFLNYHDVQGRYVHEYPATVDAFEYNRDRFCPYGFAHPLDVDLLQQHFDFPPSIQLSSVGLLDSHNFVRIAQDFGPQPVRPLSFELCPPELPLIVSKYHNPRTGTVGSETALIPRRLRERALCK